jgi:hypothetical protein
VNLSADLLSPATALPIATLASANLPLIVQWPPTVVYYAGAANGSGSLVTTDQSIFLNAPYGLADWTAIALYTLPGAGRVPAYICGDAYHQFMTTATACGPPIGYFYNVQVAGSEAVYLVDGGLACIPAFLYYTEPTGQPYGTLLGFSPSVTENHTGYTC